MDMAVCYSVCGPHILLLCLSHIYSTALPLCRRARANCRGDERRHSQFCPHRSPLLREQQSSTQSLPLGKGCNGWRQR